MAHSDAPAEGEAEGRPVPEDQTASLAPPLVNLPFDLQDSRGRVGSPRGRLDAGESSPGPGEMKGRSPAARKPGQAQRDVSPASPAVNGPRHSVAKKGLGALRD